MLVPLSYSSSLMTYQMMSSSIFLYSLSIWMIIKLNQIKNLLLGSLLGRACCVTELEALNRKNLALHLATSLPLDQARSLFRHCRRSLLLLIDIGDGKLLGRLHRTDALLLLFKCIGHVSAHGGLSDAGMLMMLLRTQGHVVGRDGGRLRYVLNSAGPGDGLPLGPTRVHILLGQAG